MLKVSFSNLGLFNCIHVTAKVAQLMFHYKSEAKTEAPTNTSVILTGSI